MEYEIQIRLKVDGDNTPLRHYTWAGRELAHAMDMVRILEANPAVAEVALIEYRLEPVRVVYPPDSAHYALAGAEENHEKSTI